jgi:predicted metal-dependent phosphoesterase TrpH
MTEFLKLEFHCHTHYSNDSLTSPAELLQVCRRKGIDRIIVTDHNNIEGALRTRDLDPGRVIVGEEIMTTGGELLAAYVKELVPRDLKPAEAIARLRQQGAFISVSHPFDPRRPGAWRLNDLLEIAPLVDAIEVFNARCFRNTPNRQAEAFAVDHHLPGTVGSDAHSPYEIGLATQTVPFFNDPQTLGKALWQGRRQVRLAGPWVVFYSAFARLRKRPASMTGVE